jgi:hypothetical protein
MPMRNPSCFSFTLCVLLTVGSVPSWATNDGPETHPNEINERLLNWCLSYFPVEDPSKGPLSRPAKELAPMKLDQMVFPPDLVTKTQTVGKLPWYVEKYRDTWIWPSVGEHPPFAVFVEGLTPTEITVALTIRRKEGEKANPYKHLREKLKWTGREFARTDSADQNEKPTRLSLHVSQFRHAMLWLTEVRNEAWPMCFISSKHY